MKEDYKNIELIDKYLDGKMTADEKAMFENQMDASTKNALENQTVVRKVVKGDRLLSIKEQMIKDLATRGTSNNLWKSFVLGTSLLAVMMGGGYLLWNSSQQMNNSTAENDKEIGKVSPEEGSSSETFSNSENVYTEETPQSTDDVQKFENEVSTQTSSKTKNEATIPTNPNGGLTSNTNDYAEPNVEQLAINEEEELSGASQTNTICNDVAINALVVTIPTCSGQDNGKIIVIENTISGGSGPYQFSIDNKDFQNNAMFSSLGKGSHTISIKDSKGCSLEKSKDVSERIEDCINTDGHATFSPSNNETFNFPIRADNSKVTVFNGKHNPVYTTTIKNKYHSSWDGIQNNGEIAQAGVYIFEVEDPSGNSIKGYLIVQ